MLEQNKLLTKLNELKDYCVDKGGALEGDTEYKKAQIRLGSSLTFFDFKGIEVAFKEKEIYHIHMDGFTYMNKNGTSIDLYTWASDLQDEIINAVNEENEQKVLSISEEEATGN